VDNVIIHSDDFAKQFVVGSVTQFVEYRLVRWAVSVTSGSVCHSVDASLVKRLVACCVSYEHRNVCCDCYSSVFLVDIYVALVCRKNFSRLTNVQF